MGNRIQSRIARLDSGRIPVYDWPAGYENQLKYRYKAFAVFLIFWPSVLIYEYFLQQKGFFIAEKAEEKVIINFLLEH